MKNVLIFALGGERYALELRWVREVATLGPLTPVPTGPALLAGVVNWKGAIVPVLHSPSLIAAVNADEAAAGVSASSSVPAMPALLPLPRMQRAPRAGDALILLDVEGTRAAIAVERVDAVTTLTDGYVDGAGQRVPALEPRALVEVARRAVLGAAGTPEVGD